VVVVHLGRMDNLVSPEETQVGMNDIVRGLGIVLAGIVILAILVGVTTIIGAGVGLVWVFLCRVVPLVLVVGLAIGAVVGVLWLIGFIARKVGSR